MEPASAAEPTILAAGPFDAITTPLTAGQKCVEGLFSDLGVTQAKCFSGNNFTAQYLADQINKLSTGGTPDPTQFQANLTGLLTCLTGTSAPAPTGSSAGGGGGATTPDTTSNVAPAATPVSGTPNFTG